MKNSARFIKLAKPLQYAVYCGKKEVIPAGAEGVYISFRSSHLRRLDEATGQMVPMNRYIYKGRIIHA